MALVSAKSNIIFCATPGTASTSISDFLLTAIDCAWTPSQSFTHQHGYFVDYKHCGIGTLIRLGLLPQEFADRAWSFCFVRNPYHWYLAEYKRHRKWLHLLDDPHSWASLNPLATLRIRMAGSMGFYEFCALLISQNRPHGIPAQQASWDLFHETTEQCKTIYSYEDLLAAEQQICARLKLGVARFPYTNKTPDSTAVRDSRSLFDKQVIQLLVDTHHETFSKYGYSTEVDAAANARLNHRPPAGKWASRFWRQLLKTKRYLRHS